MWGPAIPHLYQLDVWEQSKLAERGPQPRKNFDFLFTFNLKITPEQPNMSFESAHKLPFPIVLWW